MGEPQVDVIEEARKLSFEQRVGHKNVKVRIDAFEQLTQTVFMNTLLPTDDPRVKEAVGFVPAGLNDANAVVKDKALGALVGVFNKIKDPECYNKYADRVLPLLVGKCLKEQKSLKRCKEACLLFVEYEQGEKVIDNLVVGTENKLPKIQLNAVEILVEILAEFGTRAVPWKKILPVTAVMSESKDNKVRTHIKEILNIIAKHEGGNAIRQLVYPKFREAFQKEVSPFLDIQKSVIQVNRATVSQRSAVMEVSMEVDAGVGGTESGAPDVCGQEQQMEEEDFWEDATPENINNLFNSEFYGAMEKGKWKDKVAVLKENVNEKLGKVVRMAPPDDLPEIAKILKAAIQKDSNINVVGESTQLVAYFAKGMRQQFAVYARGILPALIERQREKNPVVSIKISECLDKCGKYCFCLSEVAEDLKTGLQHKNPRVRELSCGFMRRRSKEEDSSSISKSIKELGPALASASSDATAVVRDEAAEILAVFYSKVKTPPMQKLLQSLDDAKQKKIMELAQKHQKVVEVAAGKTQTGMVSSKQQSVNMQVQGMDKNSAKRYICQCFGDKVAKMLSSEQWKDRDMALQQILSNLQLSNFDAINLLQCLLILPGFAEEQNFQVCYRLFEVVGILCSGCEKLKDSELHACIQGVVEKLSDSRLKQCASELLLKLSQITGPQSVIQILIQCVSSHPNPITTSEAILWIGNVIVQFGINGVIDLNFAAQSMKQFVQNPNPAVRNSAVEVFGILHRFVGKELQGFVQDLKPTQLHPIKAAFERNPQQQEQQFAPGQQSQQNQKDLGSLLNSDNILNKLGNQKWSVRQEALKEIELLVTRAESIKANLSRDLIAVLKARLTDQNINVIASTLATISALIQAIGPQFERFGKILLTTALKNLNSNKNQVRIALFNFLSAWHSNVRFSVPVQELCTVLASSKCSQDAKKESLEWILKIIQNSTRVLEEGEIQAMLWLCAAGVSDKALDVREQANLALQAIFYKAGQSAISAALTQLDAGAQKTLREALQKTSTNEDYMEIDSPQKLQQATSGLPRPSTANPRIGTKISKKIEGNINAIDSSAQDENNILILNDKKEERSRRYRGRLMGKFEIRSDEQDALKHEVSLVVSQPFLKMMFSREFKDHIECADLIGRQTQLQPVICNLDLIFRWAVVRINDDKIQSQLRLLEMLKLILGRLCEAGGVLDEYEVAMLLPGIVDKLGHNQERVKVQCREVIAFLYKAHPPYKIISIVADGLESKNFKSRAETIDEIGRAVEQYNVEILLKGKTKLVLPTIAKMVGDKDKGVRGAALGTIDVVYKLQGERVWELLGKLSMQQQDVIRDRLKFTEKTLRMKGIEPGKADNTYGDNNKICVDAGFEMGYAANARIINQNSCQNPGMGYATDMPSNTFNNMGMGHVTNTQQMSTEQENTPPEISMKTDDNQGISSINMCSQSTSCVQPQLQQQQQQQLSTNSVTDVEMMSVMSPHSKANLNFGSNSKPTPGAVNKLPQPPPPISPAVRPAPLYPHRSIDDCRTAFEHHILECQATNIPQAIQAMKLLCYELMEVQNSFSNPEVPEELKAVYKQDVDSAISTLASQVDRIYFNAYELSGQQSQNQGIQVGRGPKYVTNCLLQLFSMDELMPYVKRDTIQQIIAAMLFHLVLDKTKMLDNGEEITKATNIIMSRICEQFTQTRPNDIYSVCLTLMRVPPPAVVNQGDLIEGRFKEVLVKFLIKVTKKMPQVLPRINIRKLLLDIHTYFVAIGSEQLRKRGIDDKPNRIVKTILNEMCKLKGGQIIREVGDLVMKRPPPIILSYIDTNMQALYSQKLISSLPPKLVQDTYSESRQSEPMEVDDQPTAPDGQGIYTSQRRTTSQQDEKLQLSIIFKKIGRKESQQQGLEQLYEFLQQNPSISLDNCIANASDGFKSFVRQALNRIRQQKEQQLSSTQVLRSSTEKIESLKQQADQLLQQLSQGPKKL